MTHSEFLIEAVLTMNKSGKYPVSNVEFAKRQLVELIEAGCEFDVVDEEELQEKTFSDDPYINQIIGGNKNG
jgi:hypothetical protein